ncbi:MAG: dTMP kinase [Candidatus Omnitrophica bacterium]|nr:dTMP kinase [Candidatus Omnitrophota bacterium]
MKRKGKFITFEGPEGSGKSTQIRALSRFLKEQGIRCVVTREPGGTEIGEAVRSVLLKERRARVHPHTELFLYMAARAQLVREVIRPELLKGRWVLSDRFLDASIAYQGYGHGLAAGWIRSLGRAATGGLVPDITFLLDVEAGRGLKRARRLKGRTDRIEAKPLAFHRRVRRGYLSLARREPRRIRVIPAGDSKAHVQKRIRDELRRWMRC